MRLGCLSCTHRDTTTRDTTQRVAGAASILLSVALFFGLAEPATSAIVRADFSGTLNQCPDCGYFAAAPGTRFSGFIEYETTSARDSDPNPAIGAYYNPIVDAGLQFGTYAATATSMGSGENAIYVVNAPGGSPRDSFDAHRLITPAPRPGSPPGTTARVYFTLLDPTGTSLSSDTLPSTFTSTGNALGYLYMPDYSVHGTVTAVAFSVVPIPPAAPLLLSGLAFAFSTARRWQNDRHNRSNPSASSSGERTISSYETRAGASQAVYV